MSKTIQEALDLPVLEDLLKASAKDEAVEEPEITDEMVEQFQEEETTTALTHALASGAVTPEVEEARQARDHENAMDELHKETLQHAKDLMDLGYNVDTRSAGRIFENAANMFKIALDAKNAKRDAQLKSKKLELEDRKVQMLEKNTKGVVPEGTIDAQAVIIEDRNEIIRMAREKAKGDAK